MTNAMIRPAVLDGAHAAGAAQTADQPYCPDRSAWDNCLAKLNDLWDRDRQICSRRAVAEPAGTWTDADETAWNDSSEAINMVDWELFEMNAPDLAALDWKIKMLADHDLIQEDWADFLRADIARLSSVEGR